MGAYLTIGFFVGIVMVGVYWGLPIEKTGPKNFGRIILILVAAPFLWPVQLAFYATKYLSGARDVVDASTSPTHAAIGAAIAFSPPPVSTAPPTKTEASPTQTCVTVFHTLREQVVSNGRYLPDERTTDSKFIGAVLGMIETLARSEHANTPDTVGPVMRELFGDSSEDAMALVRTGPDDDELMASLEVVQNELDAAELGSHEMYSLLGSIWRRCYNAYEDKVVVLPEDADTDASNVTRPSNEAIALSAGMPDITKRRPVRSYDLGPYTGHVLAAPPVVGDICSIGGAPVEYVFVMAVAPFGFYGSPCLLVTAERAAGAVKELSSDPDAAAPSMRLCYFDSTGHHDVSSFEDLDDKKLFSQHALSVVCKQLRLSGTPRQV